MTTRCLAAVPVLPVPDLRAALAAFEAPLGFATAFVYDDYAGVVRDGVELHLFACTEPKIAEWTSCRVVVEGIEALYAAVEAAGAVHPNGALATKPWGFREFTALVPGGAIVVFAEPVA
jgi:hypothetical protein